VLAAGLSLLGLIWINPFQGSFGLMPSDDVFARLLPFPNVIIIRHQPSGEKLFEHRGYNHRPHREVREQSAAREAGGLVPMAETGARRSG